jgi:ABC-type antimicrobial peptide transport system permease subunit
VAKEYAASISYPVTPANLVNFGEAVNFPLIFGLVLIVFGITTLVHVLVVSVARRRREAGLLRALGFVRRQIAYSVWWQTTSIALVGLVVGVPLGIAIGSSWPWRPGLSSSPARSPSVPRSLPPDPDPDPS